jgi:ADP-heptose:LPS heptosyltransferase
MTSIALVRRVAAIGDIMMVEPFLWSLKLKGYEGIYINCGQHSYIFDNHPFVKMVDQIPKNLPRDFFNLTNVYENNYQLIWQGKMPIISIPASYAFNFGLSLSPDHLIPRVYLTNEELDAGRELLGDGDWVVFYMAYPNGVLRRPFWKYADWIPVLEFLKDKGLKICLVGQNHNKVVIPDNDLIDKNLIGKTTPRQWFSVQAVAKLFVGIEGSPIILAQGFNTPGVVCLGPIVTDKMIMSSHNFEIIYSSNTEAIPATEIIVRLNSILPLDSVKSPQLTPC